MRQKQNRNIVAYRAVTMQRLPERQIYQSVCMQRLGKHFPAATDTHATIEVLLETVFSTWSVLRSYKEDNWSNRISFVWESVKKRSSWEVATVQRGLERGSWRISTVRSRCKDRADEDTADWKRLSGCCGDLWILEISGGAIFVCSFELCAFKWSLNPISNLKPRL
jgi:hypothetical protein